MLHPHVGVLQHFTRRLRVSDRRVLAYFGASFTPACEFRPSQNRAVMGKVSNLWGIRHVILKAIPRPFFSARLIWRICAIVVHLNIRMIGKNRLLAPKLSVAAVVAARAKVLPKFLFNGTLCRVTGRK